MSSDADKKEKARARARARYHKNKDAINARRRKYRAENRDIVLAQARKYDAKRSATARAKKYSSPENRIHARLSQIKMRCKKSGVDFDITIEDFESFPTHCPLLGIELNYKEPSGRYDNNLPSVDRKDPSKGYVPGNVWIISWRANSLKKDATPQELLTLAINIQDHIK